MNQQIKIWADQWRVTGAALEGIRREELQHLDVAPTAEILDGMLQWACDHAQPRNSSGLVQQQFYFAKLRPAA